MIKNVIFDFGNVLLNLDEKKTYEGLDSILDHEKCKDLKEIVFDPFERGEISEEAFFNRLQRRSLKVLNGDVYYEIWNSMLLDLPAHRIEFLKQIRQQYKIFLLSNTNITHLRKVMRSIKLNLGIQDFNSLFDGTYYSHQIHMRKPERRIYEYVLKEAGIDAKETLFIDDKLENLVEAEHLGINVHCHNPEEDISYIFNRIIHSQHGE